MRLLLAAALLVPAAGAQSGPADSLRLAPEAGTLGAYALHGPPGARCAATAPMPTVWGGDTAPLPSLRSDDGLEPVPMPNWCGGTTATVTVLPDGVRFPTPPIPFDGPDYDALSDGALIPYGRYRHLLGAPDAPPELWVPDDVRGRLASPLGAGGLVLPPPVAPPARHP